MTLRAAVSEEALLRLCDQHYLQFRRVATTLALPSGAIARLRAELQDNRALVPGHAVMLLCHAETLVALEELEGLTQATVLADRAP